MTQQTGAGDNKPYRGPESYRVEDADLFFGRDGDAERVLTTALSSRFTLLHAPSGAGKSSLLNARVIPGLELRGWMPVRTTPGDDPTTTVRHAIIDQLLPPPALEAHAIHEACLGLTPHIEDPSVRDLLAAYRALPSRDERRRRLAAPRRVTESETAWPAVYAGSVTPFFSRLLRGSLDISRYADHVNALTANTGVALSVNLATPSGVLAAAMTDARVRREFDSVIDGLANFSVFGLRAFFEELQVQWANRHPMFSVVLILDQFEELFTRFVDTGLSAGGSASSGLDWRLRKEFFSELSRLYAGPESDGGPPFPLRCVVSIRNEFIAALDDLRRIAPDLAASTIHLTFLRAADARDAIQQPAEDFGYAYEPRLFDDVMAKLTREGAYVEPAQLQIVCEKLWSTSGSALASERAGDAGELPQIDFESYERLGGTQGILAGFFREYLDALSEPDRLETLELLEPLITSSGTRNIAEWRQLVAAPFRDESHREQLLYDLARRSIVRFEARLGGRLVEVTHEFLIPAIQRAIAEEMTRSPANAGFRQAVRVLEGYRYQDFRADPSKLLAVDEIVNLDANRDRIVWPLWATELVFRSAIAREQTSVLPAWAARYDAAIAAQPVDVWLSDALHAAVSTGRTLSRPELDALYERRDGMALAPAHIEAVLRSILEQPASSERDEIVYWASRMVATRGEAATFEWIEPFTHALARSTRRNALRAGAAVTPSMGATPLVSCAIGDKDEETRAVALDEIALLGSEGLTATSESFAKALRSPDAQVRRQAYSTLSHLQARGVRVPISGFTLIERVRLAGNARPLAEFRQARVLRRGMLTPSLLGTTSGILISAAFFLWAFRTGSADMAATAGVAFLVGPILGFVAMPGAQPLRLQYFRDAGILAEIGRAALLPLAIRVLGMLVFLAENSVEISTIGDVLIAAIVGTRLATLLAHDNDAPANANAVAQAVAGSAFGVLACTASVVWWKSTMVISDAMYFAWAVMLPLIMAIALCAAWLERSTVEESRSVGRVKWPRAITIVALAGFVGVVAIVAGARTRAVRQGDVRVSGVVPPGLAVRTNSHSIELSFTLDTASTVLAYAPLYIAGHDLVSSLNDSAGHRVAYSGNRPALMALLNPGRYDFTIIDRATIQSTEIFPELAHYFGGDALFASSEIDSPFVVAVGTPAIDAFAASSTILAQLRQLRAPPRDFADLATQLYDMHPDSIDRIAAVFQSAVAAELDLNRIGNTELFTQVRALAARTGATLTGTDSLRIAFETLLRGDTLEAPHTRDFERGTLYNRRFWLVACGRALDAGLANLTVTCDLAVSEAPDNTSAHAMRGVYRARLGDLTGALQDVRAAATSAARSALSSPAPGDLRLDTTQIQRWVTALQAGENPFSQEVLRSLRESLVRGKT